MGYFDHNASTATLPEVAEHQFVKLVELTGNPSARQHGLGQAAFLTLEGARQEISLSLGCPKNSVIFTSGATESIAIATIGFIAQRAAGQRRIVVWEAEHSAVLNAVRFVETHLQATVTFLRSTKTGQIDYEQLTQEASRGVDLICISAANNETGVIPDYEFIQRVARQSDAKTLCDASQILGRTFWPFRTNRPDFLVLSGHKFGGPRGIGALLIDRELQANIDSPLRGGEQERGMRGGTSNAAGAAALSLALSIVQEQLNVRIGRLERLKQRVLHYLDEFSDWAILNTENEHRLINTFNVWIRGIDSEELLGLLPVHALASGSACSFGSDQPSHVLLSMGFDVNRARESIRISLDYSNTIEEIDCLFRDINITREKLLNV
jgi:cysteine desulfurase